VVSIHDLSTVTREMVVRMLEDLEGVGVPVTSLLVIPDHHHKGRIDADPKFVEMLQGAVERGHEAVLHGYYHLRPSKEGEGVATKVITRSYTAGEGEFYDLTREEAAGLLRRGKESLGNCGVPFTGFIAPAWLLGPESEEAVREEGFAYTTRIGAVIDCRDGSHFNSRSMVYSVRSPWRRGVSLLWNEALFHVLRNAPLLRIGLHPPDWEHEAIRHHALACIRKAAAERQVTTYGKWLDLARASRHEGGEN
jgi:predicted deacetylase